MVSASSAKRTNPSLGLLLQSSSSFLPQATLTRSLTRPTSQVGFYLDLRSRPRPRLIPSIHPNPPVLGRRAGREGEREREGEGGRERSRPTVAPSFRLLRLRRTPRLLPLFLRQVGRTPARSTRRTDGRRATRLLPESFFPLPPAPHQTRVQKVSGEERPRVSRGKGNWRSGDDATSIQGK